MRPAVLRCWDWLRPAYDRPTRLSLAVALAFAVVVGLGMYWDFQRSADGPREVATIVARDAVGPNICPGVGRGGWDPKWDVTWKSTNPPHELPAVFVEEAVCDYNVVGARMEIIRTTGNGRTKVYEDVVDSGRGALELASWTFMFVFAIVLPFTWIWFGLERWWRSRSKMRGAEEEPA